MTNNPVVITYNGIVVTTSPPALSADGNGNFAANFQIPFGSSGTVKIIAKDNLTTASTDYTSSADINFSATSGNVGTTITATGIGFNAKTAIKISYDNTQVGTITTDADGKFSTTFPVPASSTGKHQLTVTDQVVTLKYDFNILPDVTIDTSSGYVGKDINAEGTGFTASSNITVKYDASQVATIETDINGNFAVAFKVPASEAGNHQITFTDGTNTLTSDFAMDSTAPLTPTLLSPNSLTKVSQTPTLDWQDVSDPSGVTYSLEISKDAAFVIVVLQKDGLEASEYKLTTQEVLGAVSKDTPYYWRVKAIDGANNQSAWSAPSTFYVGTIIPTSVYAFIIMGLCIVVGGIAYLIERLRSR